jgi:2-keto-4-pentenoate hydratase
LDGFDWSVARALAAAGTTLRPGDVLAGPASGRVAEIERGSSVEIDVEGIGTLPAATGD